jgi:hypothetical protein
MTYIYDQFGRRIHLHDVRSVEHLEQLKKKHGNNIWPVIEACINIWAMKKPKEWKAHLYDIQELRDTRKDRKFASTKDKVTGGYLRYTLDIPEKVEMMIRCIYSPEELKMDKEYYQTFARKFPQFKVAQQL